MLKKRLAVIIPLTALTLASCSTENALESHLSSADQSSHQSLNLRSIYGDEWVEFAIVCPYAPKDTVEAELQLEDTPVPRFGFDETQSILVLKSTSSNTEWISFKRTHIVDLCPVLSDYDISFRPTDSTLDFVFNLKNNVWEPTN
ncbi:hypothetical protein YH66_07120 [[Brevibacterium] flavum]|uniref:Lipoprotein n=1 Tax=[Brevibacterium] flavum TaxID=92706 RepID=A0A0F6Z532_9CORY|nr:hypothetical protein YH66_07120 [[Brevibacterium] flavum]ANE08160.1 hypothetical protein A3654_07150 [Corynebacterium glutamicum]AST20582.1 hypothetical protein CEY17_07230 [Corynebacterium glutamicum ATCC 14067]CAF21350.1 putative secreted protein [Corynebacterium glutamicum ATCC 13032]CCH24508.1 hypothetical protein WA5_1288 [Corynebacterium glutamicum K051]